jgi:hypothetical protein
MDRITALFVEGMGAAATSRILTQLQAGSSGSSISAPVR